MLLSHDRQASAANSAISTTFCNLLHDMANMGLRKKLPHTEAHPNIERGKPLFVATILSFSSEAGKNRIGPSRQAVLFVARLGHWYYGRYQMHKIHLFCRKVA